MGKGKIIVIEGSCDGVGKTVQYYKLKERLEAEGIEPFIYHFPSYGQKRAEMVEKLLTGQLGDPRNLSPYQIHEFYANDRKETWEEILRPEYEKGRLILADRYSTSSMIYQSAFFKTDEQKKLFMKYVYHKEYIKNRLGIPDIVIFLNADFYLIHGLRSERKNNEGFSEDVYERSLEIQAKVYETAMLAASTFGWESIKSDKDSKMKPIEEIHEDVYSRVRSLVL